MDHTNCKIKHMHLLHGKLGVTLFSNSGQLFLVVCFNIYFSKVTGPSDALIEMNHI